MKHTIKIDRSSIRPNPDFSLVEKRIPTTIDAYFTVTDKNALNIDVFPPVIKYTDFVVDVNYAITNLTITNEKKLLDCDGIFLTPQIPMSGKKYDGIDIEIKQNYHTIYPDTRRYLYDYEPTRIECECRFCKDKFDFKELEDDWVLDGEEEYRLINICPSCKAPFCCESPEIEYEQFNEDMI